MKLQTIFTVSLTLLASLGARAHGQLALDNRTLSVPQQCAMYMSEEPVLKKLDLNPAQSKAYNLAVKSYISESERLEKSKTATENDRIACDLKFANACLGTLNPTQKHQLLQVGIPRIGTIALIDPAVAAQVGLLPDQVKKIKTICGDLAKRDEDVSAMIANAIDKVPEPKPGADRKKYDKKCAEVAAMYNGERQRIAREKFEADQKVVALLTPAQQAKWVDLSGPVKTK